MYYFVAIILFLFSLGYTWYKFNSLRVLIVKSLEEIEKGVRGIFSGEDKIFGEKFETALREAIHNSVDDLFGIDYDVLETIENANALIRIRYNQQTDYVAFDFSQYDDEKKLVGIDIWSTEEEPESYVRAKEEIFGGEELPLIMHPHATLLWVKHKDDDEGHPYWMWQEKEYFMMAMHDDEFFNFKELD